MSEPLGSFCLVLHGHLPYVLRHGTWPHGEDWLYEAAAETYLPILAAVDECNYFNGNPQLTMGLTPVLLEQLSHDHFKAGFVHYLEDRIERARSDKKEFEGFDNGHMAYLAQWWIDWHTARLEQFESYDRDIPKAYADRAKQGFFEILTSNATHAYMPLLYEDATIRAQIRAGIASSERILGFRPKGMWLPECAYRPQGPWDPPIQWGRKDLRTGIEHLVGDEGITHFFTESHLIEGCKSECVSDGGEFYKVGWDDATKYPARGWRSVNEPHGVNSDGSCQHRVSAFARDQAVCEKVWSGSIGYPAAGEYMEFHKKWGPRRGLRYWKVTSKNAGLGDKHLYHPDETQAKIYEHAQDFVNSVKDRLRAYQQKTDGKKGVVVTCFDAELFGHWWFEGPRFIRYVLLTMNAYPEVEVTTPGAYLEKTFVDKIATLPEGSWGEEGDHRVWANEQVNWMWDIEYRCEAVFGRLTSELPWRERDDVRELLEKAGRELLLLQASDWPFVIRRGQAIDYGTKRYMLHVARFENLVDIAEKVALDSKYLGQLNEIDKHEIADADLHDVIFPEIDLNWWNA
ncbi:MAG: 1,4-alpha-glucan branching protein domain-containing protein [Phycisphaeraceae bacterium]